MGEHQREADADLKKAEDIKTVVAEIAKTEDGIGAHQAGVAKLTIVLVVAYYRLGWLLMSLPGASANLKNARGKWLKNAVDLCGHKDRVYLARDAVHYFDDPHDFATQKSGATGEERAKAFRGTVAELKTLIKYQKENEAHRRKLEREAARVAGCQQTAGQGGPTRIAARPIGVNDVRPSRAEDESQPRPISNDSPRDTEVEDEPADEDDGEDYCAYCARELVDAFGADIRRAVSYLIRHYWTAGEALAWLTSWVAEKGVVDDHAEPKTQVFAAPEA